jgi:hypothetical protein
VDARHGTVEVRDTLERRWQDELRDGVAVGTHPERRDSRVARPRPVRWLAFVARYNDDLDIAMYTASEMLHRADERMSTALSEDGEEMVQALAASVD